MGFIVDMSTGRQYVVVGNSSSYTPSASAAAANFSTSSVNLATSTNNSGTYTPNNPAYTANTSGIATNTSVNAPVLVPSTGNVAPSYSSSTYVAPSSANPGNNQTLASMGNSSPYYNPLVTPAPVGPAAPAAPAVPAAPSVVATVKQQIAKTNADQPLMYTGVEQAQNVSQVFTTTEASALLMQNQAANRGPGKTFSLAEKTYNPSETDVSWARGNADAGDNKLLLPGLVTEMRGTNDAPEFDRQFDGIGAIDHNRDQAAVFGLVPRLAGQRISNQEAADVMTNLDAVENSLRKNPYVGVDLAGKPLTLSNATKDVTLSDGTKVTLVDLGVKSRADDDGLVTAPVFYGLMSYLGTDVNYEQYADRDRQDGLMNLQELRPALNEAVKSYNPKHAQYKPVQHDGYAMPITDFPLAIQRLEATSAAMHHLHQDLEARAVAISSLRQLAAKAQPGAPLSQDFVDFYKRAHTDAVAQNNTTLANDIVTWSNDAALGIVKPEALAFMQQQENDLKAQAAQAARQAGELRTLYTRNAEGYAKNLYREASNAADVIYSRFDKTRNIFGLFETYDANDQFRPLAELHAGMAAFAKKYAEAYNILNPDKPITAAQVRLPVFQENKDTKKLEPAGEFTVGDLIPFNDPGYKEFRESFGWNTTKDMQLRVIKIGNDLVTPEVMHKQAGYYGKIWEQYESDPLAFFRSQQSLFVK